MPLKNKLMLALVLAASLPAWAQTPAPSTAGPKPTEQVIVPQVDRRDVKLPRFASNDFSVGYHVTEDIFVEGTLGRTKVSDEDFRVVFPNVGIFPTPKQTLSYYNVVAGYNLLPGEVFFGRSNAKISQGYIVAGIGSTDFAGQKRQTITAGFGMRVVFKDWLAVQADVRDHVYSLDLLGKRQNTQNIEISAGITFFF